MRDDGLLETSKRRQCLLPQGNSRYRFPDICGRDDCVHALPRSRRRAVDRPDAAVRDGAAQDGRMQQAGTRQVVHEFAATPQKAKIFTALDGASNE